MMPRPPSSFWGKGRYSPNREFCVGDAQYSCPRIYLLLLWKQNRVDYTMIHSLHKSGCNVRVYLLITAMHDIWSVHFPVKMSTSKVNAVSYTAPVVSPSLPVNNNKTTSLPSKLKRHFTSAQIFPPLRALAPAHKHMKRPELVSRFMGCCATKAWSSYTAKKSIKRQAPTPTHVCPQVYRARQFHCKATRTWRGSEQRVAPAIQVLFLVVVPSEVSGARREWEFRGEVNCALQDVYSCASCDGCHSTQIENLIIRCTQMTNGRCNNYAALGGKQPWNRRRGGWCLV